MNAFNATAEQLAAVHAFEVCDHAHAFIAAADPRNRLNRIHARTVAAALTAKMYPRTEAGEATDERDNRIATIGDALEALINWATE